MRSYTRAGIILLVAAALCCPVTTWAQDKATPIPTEQIKALEEALTGNKEESSAARKRLAVKRMVRDAGELLKANPTAPNRFELLALLFRAQQELAQADNSKDNREAVLETCRLLAAAPDEYGALRFDADLLLSQSEMVRKGANARERAESLMSLVGRYRGTAVEPKAIKVAIAMAMELGDTLIIDDLMEIIAERFSGDLEMIAYLRENLSGHVINAWFTGTFEKSDGTVMRFPMDSLGKTTVLCFWSKDNDGMKHMQAIAASAKEHRAESYGRIQIISFNVDELPDAGESILRGLGMDWPALRLPGGRENPYYRTYSMRDPAIITLSATSRAALLMSGSWKNNSPNKPAKEVQPDYTRMFTTSLNREWASARYTSQLSSIFTGDFLILDPEGPLNPALPPELKALGAAETNRLTHTEASVPEATLLAIQDCFVMPPVRYRIPNAELKANYEKAEALCTKAIKDHPQAPNLWIVRNRRITALTGLWKLEDNNTFLQSAAAESKLVIESKPPTGTDVVARLCLAREALRTLDAKPKQIVTDFLTSLGGDKAPGPALAAAAFLALEIGDRMLYEELRKNTLDRHAENPMTWLPVSHMLNRSNRYWLYQVPFDSGWSYGKRSKYFLGSGNPEECKRTFTAEFKTLNGSSFQIPKDAGGKWSVIYFITAGHQDLKHYTKNLAAQTNSHKKFIDTRSQSDVQTYFAVLDDDTKHVEELINAQPASWKSAASPIIMVPDGLRNPLVQKLGIISEDEHPNVLVVRPDGSIAAMLPNQTAAIPNLITRHDESLVTAALEKGDIQAAKDMIFKLAPPYDPNAVDARGRKLLKPDYSTEHLRARARVYLVLKDYEKALADAEEVVTRQLDTDGSMSLRTKELDEAEAFRNQIRKLLEPVQK